ncbi:hypothetical protein ELD05_13785 [Caldicellulosiruptor changbaiensis]|uniref:Uncharacterized protein n=1 Tax=Caldicellulosiruptor changbaiensis TaxID=1222016 RepID=A0A3T0D8U2_9FIRM|nr:hypothetical protein [Caldicellulosiruptor changbaiensis]AZT91570.1 hypothetical protein ELD05_13785 [Caldicellulosiruptor changbaiensis]
MKRGVSKRKVILVFLSLLFLFILFYYNIKLTYIFQEGNPISLLKGIYKLEHYKLEIVPVAKNKLIQKVQAPEGLTPLNDYLKKYNWKFADQLGSVIIYKRGNQQLVIKMRMFTQKYVVYELYQHTLDSLK